jgi:hypothetical protein
MFNDKSRLSRNYRHLIDHIFETEIFILFVIIYRLAAYAHRAKSAQSRRPSRPDELYLQFVT